MPTSAREPRQAVTGAANEAVVQLVADRDAASDEKVHARAGLNRPAARHDFADGLKLRSARLQPSGGWGPRSFPLG
jgi:hypothetical protein